MANIGIELNPGLTSDDTPYSTQGTYRDANNIRFDKGRPEIVAGFEKVSNKTLSGACRNVLPWKDNNGVPLIGLGTHSNLYVWRGGKLSDITPVDYEVGNINASTGAGFGTGAYGKGPYGQFTNLGDYHARTWSLQTFGQTLLANPRSQPIYWWQNDLAQKAVKLADVDGAKRVPDVANCILVTQYRQVIAFGCHQEYDAEGGVGGPFNPLCIRGSDIDGNLTDWQVSNANNAFEYSLPHGGLIVGARNWGDRLAIWTQSGLFMGTFTGDSNSVYRFDAVDGSLGLIGPNAATVIGQTLFWVSPDLQLWQCALGGEPVAVVCTIQDDTLSHISPSQGDKVVVSYFAGKNEIRIDYPDLRDGNENSRYIMFCISEGAWSKGIMNRTAMARGTVIEFPVGANTENREEPYPLDITDLTTAQAALQAIQTYSPTRTGVNKVVRANASSVAGGSLTAVTDILTGESLWGFRFTGDGSTALHGRIGTLGLTVADKVSVSYTAQVVIGPNVSMTTELRSLGGSSVDYTGVQAVTNIPKRFKHEFLTAQATDNVLNFKFASLPNGVKVEITDIKVEVREQASDWTPAPTDTGLYTVYLNWLTSTEYPQTVGNFYYHENGRSFANENIEWHLETNDFATDEDFTNMYVRGFIPDFANQEGDVYLTVYVRNRMQDKERAVGPFKVSPGQDRVDFRVTGKIMRFKLSGSSNPCSLRIGRVIFDAVPTGTR